MADKQKLVNERDRLQREYDVLADKRSSPGPQLKQRITRINRELRSIEQNEK